MGTIASANGAVLSQSAATGILQSQSATGTTLSQSATGTTLSQSATGIVTSQPATGIVTSQSATGIVASQPENDAGPSQVELLDRMTERCLSNAIFQNDQDTLEFISKENPGAFQAYLSKYKDKPYDSQGRENKWYDDGDSSSQGSDDDLNRTESDDGSDEDDSDDSENDTGDTVAMVQEHFEKLNGHFSELQWPENDRDALKLFMMGSQESDWTTFVPAVDKIGEYLAAPKTLESILLIRVGVEMMRLDREASDLVDPSKDVFHTFWEKGKTLVTCVMQGGKTRRAIFLRGYLHGGVHGRHVVVFANSQGTSYLDMQSAIEGFNKDYQSIVAQKVGPNRYLDTEEVFLYSRLNLVEALEKLEHKKPMTVHFNVRLSNKPGLNSLSRPFGGRFEAFTKENAHLIIDESHDVERQTQFGKAMRIIIDGWDDATYVTATPDAQLLLQSLNESSGAKFRLVHIEPRPGYYLYGHDANDPLKDSSTIKVVQYDDIDDCDQSIPAVSFPETCFPRPRQQVVKLLKQRSEQFGLQADQRQELEASLVCAMPRSYQARLDQHCRQQCSRFMLVLNDFHASTSSGSRTTWNIGHGKIAYFMAQNAIAHAEKRNTISSDSSTSYTPSVVSISWYNYSRTPGLFSRPRIFFNEKFRKALARVKNVRRDLLDSLYTMQPQDANHKCLLSSRNYERLFTILQKVVDAAKLLGGKGKKGKKGRKGKESSRGVSDHVLRVDQGVFSFEKPVMLDIKATLSLVKLLHEMRFDRGCCTEENKRKAYQKRPLLLSIVGHTLIKQAINVESKCREIQLTDVCYLSKDSTTGSKKFDLTKIMQALGRVDHGFNTSPFYRSAYPHAGLDKERMRPIVSVTSQIKNAVMRAKQITKTIITRSADEALDTIHRNYFPGNMANATLQGGVPKLNHREETVRKRMREESLGEDLAAAQSSSSSSHAAVAAARTPSPKRRRRAAAVDKLKRETRDWVDKYWSDCPQRDDLVQALYDNLCIVDTLYEECHSVSTLCTLFGLDERDDLSSNDQLMFKFLNEKASSSPWALKQRLSNMSYHLTKELKRRWGFAQDSIRSVASLTNEQVQALPRNAFLLAADAVEEIANHLVRGDTNYDLAALAPKIFKLIAFYANKLNDQHPGVGFDVPHVN